MGKKLNEVKNICEGFSKAALSFRIVSNDEVGEAALTGFARGISIMAFFVKNFIEDGVVEDFAEEGRYADWVEEMLRAEAEHLGGRDE